MAIPLLGGLIFKFRGRHKRGVRIEGLLGAQKDYFECPTCGRITSYRKKPNVIPLKAAG